MKYALCIVHAAHRAERVAPFQRLLAQLEPVPADVAVHYETEPAHYRDWSERAWRFLAESGADFGIILQDDSVVCPGFWDVLDRIVAARPKHVIGLTNSQLKDMPIEADKRGLRWVTSCDGLKGHGILMAGDAWRDVLAWRQHCLNAAVWERPSPHTIGEDTILSLWAMHRRALIWHPVPAVVDHDSSLESTWGNPHPAESLRATVPPREGMAELNWDTDAVHVGRLFRGNHRMLLTDLRGPDMRARAERFYELEGNRA